MNSYIELPNQLELPFISEFGDRVDPKTFKPCIAIESLDLKYVVPGADANLCRCPSCLKSAAGGVWWTDQHFRREWFVQPRSCGDERDGRRWTRLREKTSEEKRKIEKAGKEPPKDWAITASTKIRTRQVKKRLV